MAKSLNKVMLIGNLGKDPELRYTGGGAPVATFSLATNESWKDQDGNLQERTEWHNIVAWAKLAEICQQYLKKGRRVYVEGRIQTRSYDDKNTGAKKYMTEVVANNMIMLDPREQSDSGSSYSAPETPATGGDSSKDDLPF